MLIIKNLDFSYTEDPILKDINLHIKKGSFITILGESGSGKSTLLKLIYGLLDWKKGSIILNKTSLLGSKGNLVPGELNMKWVSQDFNLKLNTTVAENVGNDFSNVDLLHKDKKINTLLEIVDLMPYKNTKVNVLSGGQQQRVALASALATPTELLLLDEPFSQIDNYRKTKIQNTFLQYIKKEKITTLMVTHNIHDALSFSDEIYVLHKGVFIENEKPKTLFHTPKKLETAKLIGDINIIEGSLLGKKDSLIFLHPTMLKVSKKGTIEVTIVQSYFKGYYYRIEGLLKNKTLIFYHKKSLKKGKKVMLKINNFNAT